MNPISIFCPVTNRSVETGIETNWSTFFKLRPFRMRVRCPQCGGRHEMAVREGYLARSEAGLDSGRPQENPQIESLLAKLAQN
jgi:hypothetical protein